MSRGRCSVPPTRPHLCLHLTLLLLEGVQLCSLLFTMGLGFVPRSAHLHGFGALGLEFLLRCTDFDLQSSLQQ